VYQCLPLLMHLFAAVQLQPQENQRRLSNWSAGCDVCCCRVYHLQAFVVMFTMAKASSVQRSRGKPRDYAYYRCIAMMLSLVVIGV